MIHVYGIRNCDTIRKTLNWLTENHLTYRFHDYRKEGLSEPLLGKFLARYSVDDLINRRGTTWRQLPESVRKDLTEESARALMLEKPSLIRRPILTDGNSWLLGFDPQAIARTLIS